MKIFNKIHYSLTLIYIPDSSTLKDIDSDNATQTCSDDEECDYPLTKFVALPDVGIPIKRATDSPTQIEDNAPNAPSSANRNQPMNKSTTLNIMRSNTVTSIKAQDSYSISSFDSGGDDDDSVDMVIGDAPIMMQSDIVQVVLEDNIAMDEEEEVSEEKHEKDNVHMSVIKSIPPTPTSTSFLVQSSNDKKEDDEKYMAAMPNVMDVAQEVVNAYTHEHFQHPSSEPPKHITAPNKEPTSHTTYTTYTTTVVDSTSTSHVTAMHAPDVGADVAGTRVMDLVDTLQHNMDTVVVETYGEERSKAKGNSNITINSKTVEVSEDKEKEKVTHYVHKTTSKELLVKETKATKRKKGVQQVEDVTSSSLGEMKDGGGGSDVAMDVVMEETKQGVEALPSEISEKKSKGRAGKVVSNVPPRTQVTTKESKSKKNTVTNSLVEVEEEESNEKKRKKQKSEPVVVVAPQYDDAVSASNTGIRILFTGIEYDDAMKSHLSKMGHGATVEVSPSLATHLVTLVPLKRTPKLMIALNSGVKYVVNERWVEDSAANGSPLEIDIQSTKKSPYLICDRTKEKLWNFKLLDVLKLPRGCTTDSGGVFSNLIFFVTNGVCGQVAPPAIEMKQIIESGGGKDVLYEWVTVYVCTYNYYTSHNCH